MAWPLNCFQLEAQTAVPSDVPRLSWKRIRPRCSRWGRWQRFPVFCVLDLEVKPSPPMTYIACVLGARLSGSRHSLQCACVAWTTLIPLGSQQRRCVLCRCPLRPSESLASWTHPPSAGRVILGVIAVLRAVDCGVGNVGPGPSEVPPLALPTNCVG